MSQSLGSNIQKIIFMTKSFNSTGGYQKNPVFKDQKIIYSLSWDKFIHSKEKF